MGQALLEEYGVRLRSLDDSGDGEDAEHLNGLKSLLAKRERRGIAERSRMGKVQKVREGRLVASKAPAYGFDYNETRDGYVVNEEQMRVVRRIFEWVVLDRLSITGVVNRPKDGGVRSPSGVGRWDRAQISNMINSDIYRAYTKEELSELGVALRVVASLPDGLYGVAWYGKRRVKLKARAKAEVTKKDPKEWIPVPVVDAGLERDLVDAARLAIADNRSPSKNADRFWELSGGIVICGDCGRRMLATSRKRKVSREGSFSYYYYVCQCGRYSWDDRCSHNHHHSATELERQVWEGVSGFLSDPERMRQGLENPVAHEAKVVGGLDAAFAYWGEILSQVKVKSERLLDLYLEGTLEKVRYEERTKVLEAQEREARRTGEGQGSQAGDRAGRARHRGPHRVLFRRHPRRTGALGVRGATPHL